MTYLRTVFIAVAALSLGALFGGGGLVQARLGTGGAGGADDAGDLAGLRVGSESGSRISTVGQCNTNKTRFRTETVDVSTTSTTFVNMPNSHRVIPVGANGCIIVTVTGLFGSLTSNYIQVRAAIQGGPIAEPPYMEIGRPAASDVYPRTMQFVFTNLPAGNHTVRLFYRSLSGTGIVVVHRMIKYEYR